tara:strand:+ start:1154 stop:1444 length:291 start_codon:yes stop_codon:yes gene_type:complete
LKKKFNNHLKTFNIMTTEKYLRQRVMNQNIEITTLTQQIDTLTSKCVDLQEQLKDTQQQHLEFVQELQQQVRELTNNLEDLQMDVCRDELDQKLWD